jgi:hypothetical protein
MPPAAEITPVPLDDLYDGALGLTTVRPAPYSEARLRQMAEEYYANMPEGPVKRVKMDDWIRAARLTDKSFCANSRVPDTDAWMSAWDVPEAAE